MRCIFVAIFLLFSYHGFAEFEQGQNLLQLQPNNHSDNQVMALVSHSQSSSFLVFINSEIKPHYHQNHTETIYIIAGSGTTYIDGKAYQNKAGQFFTIAPGVVHSVSTKPGETLHALSTQAPEFFGKDRVYIKQ